jgi:hypothetical protein
MKTKKFGLTLFEGRFEVFLGSQEAVKKNSPPHRGPLGLPWIVFTFPIS